MQHRCVRLIIVSKHRILESSREPINGQPTSLDYCTQIGQRDVHVHVILTLLNRKFNGDFNYMYANHIIYMFMYIIYTHSYMGSKKLSNEVYYSTHQLGSSGQEWLISTKVTLPQLPEWLLKPTKPKKAQSAGLLLQQNVCLVTGQVLIDEG